ncbi:MAG: hypothetical protein KME35_15400 [Aphanocapsa sp. GSE-SYN-MK-11-07L]|jgi:hypothetical protein|nr:hypothetical protein [Aphanocapsa sp. GSE-SYN-MK-11-07L]
MERLLYAMIITTFAALGSGYLNPVATAPQTAPGAEAFHIDHPQTIIPAATQSI